MSKRPTGRESKTIQVYLRVRPPNSGELQRSENCDVVHTNPSDKRLVTLGDSKDPKTFSEVFRQDVKQSYVFEQVAKKAVEDAFEGYHGMVFVYGQTGTGKTFTMSNKSDNPELEGMLQRSVGMVFNKIVADKAGDYDVQCQFIQIYREVIQDLFDANRGENEKKIAIRDDPDVEGGVYLTPVKTMPVYGPGTSAADGIKTALHLFKKGDSNRAVTATNMNDVSSRSHTVFTLFINRRNKMTEADYENDNVNKEEFKGRLILVDLAGCERQKKTGATGQALHEANSINGSLLILGKCIAALTDPKLFVPFRESRLTRMLQYGLSGQGKTSIIITCGPSEAHIEETKCAIDFGQRAMTIKVNAKKHVEIDYKALCKQLQAQLDGRGDVANQQLLDEVKADYEEVIASKDEKIQLLEAELSVYTGRPASAGPASPIDKSGGKSASTPSLKAAAQAPAAAAAAAPDMKEFKRSMRKLEDKLEAKGQELQKAKKEKLAMQREKNELDGKLHQKAYDMNILATRLQHSLREKDDQLARQQAALLKLKKADVKSMLAVNEDAAGVDDDDDGPSPRPEGMKDDEFIQKLQFAMRKMREREAMLTEYHGKAREAIQYLNELYQTEKEKKGKLARELEKARK